MNQIKTIQRINNENSSYSFNPLNRGNLNQMAEMKAENDARFEGFNPLNRGNLNQILHCFGFVLEKANVKFQSPKSGKFESNMSLGCVW